MSPAETAPPSPTRRDKLLCFANLFLLIAAITISVGFFMWRQDKPPNNPNGPLRSMGEAVVWWEWFALAPGPTLCTWSAVNILRVLGKTIKARYGQPPPLPEGVLACVSQRDSFIAAGCFLVVLCIAVYIATHPAPTWRNNLPNAALILISLSLSFGILPPLRKDIARWVRWIAAQHRRS